MIYKVFYQETKERNPRRENTHSLYLDIDAKDELEGRIKARKLVEEKTPYNVELITLLSDKHLEYEKNQATLQLRSSKPCHIL
ncbi:DNA-directed RNA polymerase subunit epsilon [Streptococcus anginosus]|nr:DNA-directed RNA polymerase subunit epsilon [Streptococcus anginosus]WEB34665.1 DNA-directed RNA polymerase subunit epsilon [Streptococcus anginosus]